MLSAVRAVQIAQHVKGPLKVVWTREEDIQHDMYPPRSTSGSEQMEFLTGTGCDQHLLSSGGRAGSRVPMARLGCRRRRVPRLVFGSPRWNTPSDERRTTPGRPEQTSTTVLQEEA
jgi:hypothetical protein